MKENIILNEMRFPTDCYEAIVIIILYTFSKHSERSIWARSTMQ